MVAKRAAFTLIELIFAIVIISIVFLSLPSLSMSNTEAIESAIAQEAVFASSAKLSQVLSYHWDDNSEHNDTYSKVVDLGTTDGLLDRNGTSNYRIGHILEDSHRRMHVQGSARSTVTLLDNSNDTIANNDIDDQISSGNLFSLNPSETGYKKTYTYSVAVNFVSDSLADNYAFTSATTGTSNMKMVTITVVNDEDEEITRLRSYAANIGGIDYFHRRY